MKASVNVVVAIRKLTELLRSKTSDPATLDQITAYTHDRDRWQSSHDLLDQVRFKTVRAWKRGDTTMKAQYLFKEACVKTFYNLGHFLDPFDPDAPYWIIPRALCAAERFSIDQQKVIGALEAEPEKGSSLYFDRFS